MLLRSLRLVIAFIITPVAVANTTSNHTPNNQQYHHLSKALQHYKQLEESGAWSQLPTYSQVLTLDPVKRAALLHNLLLLTGDIVKPGGSLQKGLISFQARHKLPSSGILDYKSYQALARPPEEKAAIIAKNLTRLDQLPENMGDRYVLVNIADYSLKLVEDSKTKLTMKVIVGKKARQTPIWADTIKSIVVNPPWNVPRKIAVKDILPKLRRQPDFLQNHNFLVLRGWGQNAQMVPPYSLVESGMPWQKVSYKRFPYRLKQLPGPGNALGRFKFDFPNKHSVYLHDTSQPHLFRQNNRALSSGCVRVEKPRELAESLLGLNRGWQPTKLDRLLDTSRTVTLRLEQPIPIYLAYMTAWVDTLGKVHFAKDIYGHDQRPLEVARR
ncbi:L,D-transpeptidase family protein [Endozoicomonas sp. SM1973]|uniref:L,D-transpeptidase family protein n=1 Tax=Spartinivicinus marinus TaxID=2994442 RepID=A0A853I2V8_9GAMM|nr:L,D-transpeptidase family protein [Spartinivicinus marinus]NYZ68290.1 L,D-transpeptidase family protein [Spartinivicinus marinus]